MSMVLFLLLLLAVLILCLLAGRSIGQRIQKDAETSRGAAAVDSIVFAVLGLLVAFTFTAAASRFDERRRLVIDQANAVGTAWLRTDLLPEADRPAVRERMKRWIPCAIDASRKTRGSVESKAALDEAFRLQGEIWRLVISSYERDPRPAVQMQLIPALNEWFDLATQRLELAGMRIPVLVTITLLALAMIASVLIGFEMSSKRLNWLHTIFFASTMTFSIFVIFDLANPREGLIRIDASDQVLMDLFNSFNVPPATSPGTLPATVATPRQSP
jgi:hypothetical protein